MEHSRIISNPQIQFQYPDSNAQPITDGTASMPKCMLSSLVVAIYGKDIGCDPCHKTKITQNFFERFF